MCGIVIPGRTELDELGSVLVREHPLQTFVELLGKICNILGCVEFRVFQFFWWWFNRSCRGQAMGDRT